MTRFWRTTFFGLVKIFSYLNTKLLLFFFFLFTTFCCGGVLFVDSRHNN